MSVELKKLGNYPELKTDEGIDSLFDYIDNGNLPANLINVRQQNRFISKYRDFVIGADPTTHVRHVVYRPNPDIVLAVARPRDYRASLQEVYDMTIPTGINSFYTLVCQHFLGITKFLAGAFLKSKGNYQIGTNFKKVQNTHILAKTSNERWGMDLIDMNAYKEHGYKWIVTVVDYFSRKVFARAITAKDAGRVRDAFDSIITEAHSSPHILQTDNGGEFRGELSDYIDAFNIAHPHNHILHVFTTTYTPTGNGLVERMNEEIRRKIRAIFVEYNSRLWVRHLVTIVETLNSQIPSRRKYSPTDLYEQGYNPPPNSLVNFNHAKLTDQSTSAEILNSVKASTIKEASRLFQKASPSTTFRVGDHVRIKLLTLLTEMRLREKEGANKKKNAIRWTLYTYTIRSVHNGTRFNANNLPSRKIWNIRRPSYTLFLHNPPHPPVIVYNEAPAVGARLANAALGLPARDAVPAHLTTVRQFWGSDLMHIPDPATSTPPSILPVNIDRIRYINRLPPYDYHIVHPP